MGDSSNTQTDTYQNQMSWGTPYPGAQGLYDAAYGDAMNLYGGGSVPDAFWNATQDQATYGMYDTAWNAIAQNPLQGTMNEFASTYGTDGFNQTQRDALSALQGMQSGTGYQPFATGQMNNQAIGMLQGYTSGQNNPALAGFSQMAGQQSPYASQQNLSGIAAGQYLNREDPNFERMLNLASERAATEAGLAAGLGGRYGSSAHQGVVTRNVGDMQANARMGQYQFERGQQMTANQMLDAARAQQDATRLSALSGQAGTYADDRNRELSAINALGGFNAQDMDRQLSAIGADEALKYQALMDQFNMGQQGMTNLASAGDIWASLYGAQMQPYNDLYAVSQTPYQQMEQLLGLANYSTPYAANYQEANTSSNSDTSKDNTLGTLAGVATLL